MGQGSPNQWFYSRTGLTHGPVSRASLRYAAQLGSLTPRHLIWRRGLLTWVSAGTIPDLFVAAALRPQRRRRRVACRCLATSIAGD